MAALWFSFFLTYKVSEGPRTEEVISNALGIILISFFVSAKCHTACSGVGFKDEVRVLPPLLFHSLRSMLLQFPLSKRFLLIHIYWTMAWCGGVTESNCFQKVLVTSKHKNRARVLHRAALKTVAYKSKKKEISLGFQAVFGLIFSDYHSQNASYLAEMKAYMNFTLRDWNRFVYFVAHKLLTSKQQYT